MKRLISLVLLFCIAGILLTGCGDSEETNVEPQYANVNEMRADLQEAGITVSLATMVIIISVKWHSGM